MESGWVFVLKEDWLRKSSNFNLPVPEPEPEALNCLRQLTASSTWRQAALHANHRPPNAQAFCGLKRRGAAPTSSVNKWQQRACERRSGNADN